MITGGDLIDAGWPEGPLIADLLERARYLEDEKGIADKKYILKLLRRDVAMPAPKLGLRDAAGAAPLAEAIEAHTPDEEKNVAKVRRQMGELLRTPVIQRGAVMPDACPVGGGTAVIPVGGAIAVEHAIIPTAHSADICCSLYASFYRSAKPVGDQLDALVAATRFGPGGRDDGDLVDHPVLDEDVWSNKFLKGLETKARIHMADQGDGNHFAFLGEIDAPDGAVPGLPPGRYQALVTHHGSRGLGAAVYNRGQAAAVKATNKIAAGIPPAAAWLDVREPEGGEYWEALQYVGRWTLANHQSIHRRFLESFGDIGADATLGNEHNFVWRRGDVFLHGKGATPAWDGQLGLIPLNMAEPILIVRGRDNPEFLSFAPHGAGRNLSRTAVRRQFRDPETAAAEIARSTAGLDIRWFTGSPDLTETPVAYKNAAQVRAQIDQFGLAEVLAEIRPLGCIMAGGGGLKPWEEGYEKPLTPKQKRQIQHRAERRKTRQRDWDGDSWDR